MKRVVRINLKRYKRNKAKMKVSMSNKDRNKGIEIGYAIKEKERIK
jgi:hypothetical protein